MWWIVAWNVILVGFGMGQRRNWRRRKSIIWGRNRSTYDGGTCWGWGDGWMCLHGLLHNLWCNLTKIVRLSSIIMWLLCRQTDFPRDIFYDVFFSNDEKYYQFGTDFPKIRCHLIDIFWKLKDQNIDDYNVYLKSLNKYLV